MKSYNFAALTALLSAGAQAVPMAGHGHNHAKDLHAHMHHAKRDVVWETAYEVETVTVVKTVFEGGSPAPGGYKTIYPTDKPSSSAVVTSSSKAPVPSPSSPAETSKTTPAAVPTSETYAPVPTSSSSTYVAPPPSSTTQAPPPPSSSSEAPAPPPSSSYVAPLPETSTYAPPPPSTTESAPAPSATYGSSGGSSAGSVASGTYSGDFTHWDPALGACGISNSNTDHVVAISKVIFDKYTPNGNPNNNPLCGKTVTLNGKDGSPYPATIVDRCEGCKEPDLDLTITLFNIVTSNGDGRVPNMSWSM